MLKKILSKTLASIKKSVLVYTLITLSISSSLYAEPKSSTEYWQEVNLQIEDVQRFINQETCYLSPKENLACLYALNRMAQYLSSPSELVVQTDDFDQLSLVIKEVEQKEQPTQKESLYHIFQKDKKFKDKKRTSFINLYKSNNSPQTINFDLLMSDMKKTFADKTPEAAIFADVINAFLSSYFDPHTGIIPRAQMEEQSQAQQRYAGIGSHIKNTNGQFVVYPMENSPAAQAGVKNGDIILTVDGQDISKLSPSETISLLKGSIGTRVQLTLKRKMKTVTVTITRDQISIKNVTYKVVKNNSISFGYIKLRSFTSRESCDNVKEAITQLEEQQVKGLILDLRNNPGGLMTQADCISGLFLPKGSITVQTLDLDKTNSQLQPTYNDSEQITKLPMITLINAGSASASEIVSGTLQDYNRSWVLGDRSFGKGTVQSVLPAAYMGNLITSESAKQALLFKRTIQVFHQPNGTTNQIVGIQPEFDVPEKPGMTQEERFTPREGDLYPNLIRTGRERGKPTRLKKAQEITNNCITKSGIAKESYEKEKDDLEVRADYQLAYAQDVLRCVQNLD